MLTKISFMDDHNMWPLQEQFNILNRLGITYCSLLILPKNKEIPSISFYSNKDWGNNYDQKQYGRFDKIDRYIKKFEDHLAPWMCLGEDKIQKEISAEREKQYNIWNGITKVTTDGDLKYAISIATDREEVNFLSKAFQNFEIIDCFFWFSRNHLLKQHLSG